MDGVEMAHANHQATCICMYTVMIKILEAKTVHEADSNFKNVNNVRSLTQIQSLCKHNLCAQKTHTHE